MSAVQIKTTTRMNARIIAIGIHSVVWRTSLLHLALTPITCRPKSLPVLLGHLRHGLRRFVQPVGHLLSEITQHLGALIEGGKMQICRLFSHGLQDRLFVTMLWELAELNSLAMRS